MKNGMSFWKFFKWFLLASLICSGIAMLFALLTGRVQMPNTIGSVKKTNPDIYANEYDD